MVDTESALRMGRVCSPNNNAVERMPTLTSSVLSCKNKAITRQSPSVKGTTCLVGVDTIVNQRPTYASRVEGHTDVPVDGTRDGRPPEECAPVESQP